jgi:hypothetical protein
VVAFLATLWYACWAEYCASINGSCMSLIPSSFPLC